MGSNLKKYQITYTHVSTTVETKLFKCLKYYKRIPLILTNIMNDFSGLIQLQVGPIVLHI